MKRPWGWQLTWCPVCENDLGGRLRAFERDHPGKVAQSIECDACLTDIRLECTEPGVDADGPIDPTHYIFQGYD